MSAVLGSNYILTWTSDNLPSTDYVIVELQVNGGSWTTLNSYYPNSGSYSWYVVGHIGDVLVFRISDWQ